MALAHAFRASPLSSKSILQQCSQGAKVIPPNGIPGLEALHSPSLLVLLRRMSKTSGVLTDVVKEPETLTAAASKKRLLHSAIGFRPPPPPIPPGRGGRDRKGAQCLDFVDTVWEGDGRGQVEGRDGVWTEARRGEEGRAVPRFRRHCFSLQGKKTGGGEGGGTGRARSA